MATITLDILQKHLGIISDPISLSISDLSHGYIMSSGQPNTSTSEDYVFGTTSALQKGDVLHVVARGTTGVSVISSVAPYNTAYTSLVLGRDGNQYLDYYYVVTEPTCFCISSYHAIQTAEVLRNILASSAGRSLSELQDQFRCYGVPEDATPSNPFYNAQTDKYVSLNGTLQTESGYRVTRSLPASCGDIVYLKAKLTQNVAAISLYDAQAGTYTPVVSGRAPVDGVPSEYRYLVRSNCHVVLTYFVGSSAQPAPYDIRFYRSFLSETLAEEDLEEEEALNVSGSGPPYVLTTAMFYGHENRTFVIDRLYTLNGATVVVPKGCTLLYRGSGRLYNGSVLFQQTRLMGSVQNDVTIVSGSTIRNAEVFTSWFCPLDSTDAAKLLRLNNLIGNLSCQVLSFDQDFTLQNSTTGQHVFCLANDGIHLKSDIKYRGNGHVITIDTSYAGFSTCTYINSITPICNIELSGFKIKLIPNKAVTVDVSPGNYASVHLGSISGAYIHDCEFNGWWGSAITINYIPLPDRAHMIATAENVVIEDCLFNCTQKSAALGNGITISNGQCIRVRKCTFLDIDTTGTRPKPWPGPIDIEAECLGAVFDDIIVSDCYFENCGALGAVNFAVDEKEHPEMFQAHFGNILIKDNVVNGVRRSLSLARVISTGSTGGTITLKNNRFENIIERLCDINQVNVTVNVIGCRFYAYSFVTVQPSIIISCIEGLLTFSGCQFTGFQAFDSSFSNNLVVSDCTFL